MASKVKSKKSSKTFNKKQNHHFSCTQNYKTSFYVIIMISKVFKKKKIKKYKKQFSSFLLVYVSFIVSKFEVFVNK